MPTSEPPTTPDDAARQAANARRVADLLNRQDMPTIDPAVPRRFSRKQVIVEAVCWDGTAEHATSIIDWVLAHGGSATYHCNHVARVVLSDPHFVEDVDETSAAYARHLLDVANGRTRIEQQTDPRGHEAPDVYLSDLPKVPTGPGQPVTDDRETVGYWQAERGRALDVVVEQQERIEKVLALHESRESATGASGPWCAEDGRPWPCQTVKILTVHEENTDG